MSFRFGCFVLFLFSMNAFGMQFGSSSDTTDILAAEIRRHVVIECTVMLVHKKYVNDFEPVHFAVNIRPGLIKNHRNQMRYLTNQILNVVHRIRAFSTRVTIYDVYYEVCIGEETLENAEGRISRLIVSNAYSELAEEDDKVDQYFDSFTSRERSIRDRNRIKIMQYDRIISQNKKVRLKNESVVQEYLYDIELWDWDINEQDSERSLLHNRSREHSTQIERKKIETTRAIQKVLTSLGYYKGALDGIHGPLTKDAVLEYQKANGLIQSGKSDKALLAIMKGKENLARERLARKDRNDNTIAIVGLIVLFVILLCIRHLWLSRKS